MGFNSGFKGLNILPSHFTNHLIPTSYLEKCFTWYIYGLWRARLCWEL